MVRERAESRDKCAHRLRSGQKHERPRGAHRRRLCGGFPSSSRLSLHEIYLFIPIRNAISGSTEISSTAQQRTEASLIHHSRVPTISHGASWSRTLRFWDLGLVCRRQASLCGRRCGEGLFPPNYQSACCIQCV